METGQSSELFPVNALPPFIGFRLLLGARPVRAPRTHRLAPAGPGPRNLRRSGVTMSESSCELL